MGSEAALTVDLKIDGYSIRIPTVGVDLQVDARRITRRETRRTP